MRQDKAKQLLKSVQKSYKVIAAEFSTTRQNPGEEFPQFLPYIEGTVVDLGCGNGRFAHYLNQRRIGLPKFEYIGIDSSAKLLRIARLENPHKENKNTTFKKGDFLKLPLKNEQIDTIISIRAFHHIPSKKLRQAALKEMERTLKPDGTVIITVWNLWQRKYLPQLVKAFFRSLTTLGAYDYNDTFIPWGKKTKRYYHAFTSRELRKLLAKTGFKVIDFQSGKDLIITAKKNA